jgi:hypothetical protein
MKLFSTEMNEELEIMWKKTVVAYFILPKHLRRGPEQSNGKPK